MIKACIFDLGGTIVDRYSLTSILSLQRAFTNKYINVPSTLIRKDIGLNTIDHINQILEDNSIQNQWYNKHLDYIDDKVTQDIFNNYSEILEIETHNNNMKIIPQVKKCIQYLKENNISTGVMTGYDKYHMDNIKLLLENKNIYLDNYVSSTILDKSGIPENHMIYENLDKLNIEDSKTIIKIGDTVTGIQEGLNAGCITVGVYRWSSYMNIESREEMLKIDNIIMSDGYNYSDNYYQLVKKMSYSKRKLEESGAHYVIQTLEDLPNIIEHINQMKSPNPYNLYF